MSNDAPPHLPDGPSGTQEALLDALSLLMEPLARLCVEKGMPFQVVEEKLKESFIAAARKAHSSLPPKRLHSRISTATGLNRREVARIDNKQGGKGDRPRERKRAPAAEVFTRWRSDPGFQGKNNQPLALPRQGAAPSFEALAQSVTRDVHPRTLLEELCRLKLAVLDPATDTVSLQQNAFVPHGDWSRMLAFLGDNVGDHLSAAVDNVLGNSPQHLEQAIYADELSEASMAQVRTMMTLQWQSMLSTVAPKLEELIEADRVAGRQPDQRLRLGLFTYTQAMAALPQAKPTPERMPSSKQKQKPKQKPKPESQNKASPPAQETP